MTWVGHGTPGARVGETATFAIEVTNLGPDTAVGTFLGTGEADQLNLDHQQTRAGVPALREHLTGRGAASRRRS